MKIAMIIAYIAIAVLAVVAFMQWLCIKKLMAPGSGSGTESNSSEPGSMRFGDMVDQIKNQLQPKEINIKLN